MSVNQGKFVWYDVMTSDMKAAEAFYCKVVGWEAKGNDVNEQPYVVFQAGAAMIGGLMPIPDAARADGARSMWSGYIGVDDVDAYAKKVVAAGGAIHRQPSDIPNVGRFAVAADPTGAMFILFRGSSDEAPTRAAPGTPGHVGWHELHAGDGEKAFAFYANLFGWTKTEFMDMSGMEGATGVYQMFATGGKDTVGAVMTKMPDTPMPHWLYYFNVEAIDAAADRVKGGGGKVVMGPHEVPGPMWIVQCLDPQGAMFALVAPKR
ncbi:MAG: VOC family protein [Variovorax sp.]